MTMVEVDDLKRKCCVGEVVRIRILVRFGHMSLFTWTEVGTVSLVI